MTTKLERLKEICEGDINNISGIIISSSDTCWLVEQLRSSWLKLSKAREALSAANEYDKAIRQYANSPETMSSFCTAEGESLDKLYFDWISKSRKALKEIGVEE